MSNTKELVFYRPHPSRSHMPSAVDNIEQVKIARLLGVMFSSSNLNFDEHVTYVLSICSQRLYLIKLLRSQGMPENKLHIIFVALIIIRISYASSAWGGFLNSQQINRINAFLRKACRFGICSSTCICDASERLTVDYVIVYKALPIVSHTYFHQKSSTLAYIPEDIVMHSLYAQITFVNDPLFPDVYFVSFNNCVFIVSSVAIVLGHNICICYLIKRYHHHIIQIECTLKNTDFTNTAYIFLFTTICTYTHTHSNICTCANRNKKTT